jgi:hypothetical protein
VNYKPPTPAYLLPCTIDGCDALRHSNGLCGKHAFRKEKYGSPHITHHHVEKHGMTDHPLYGTWLNMRNRCHNPNSDVYEFYGGRGIQVCERWLSSFSAFVSDVGDRPAGKTLDRIDNGGDYEPGNVRWVTRSAQSKNQRTRRDNTSGHKGVSWDPRRGKWRAYTGGGRSRIELGAFYDYADAVAARHRATVDDLDIVCCDELEGLRRQNRVVA